MGGETEAAPNVLTVQKSITRELTAKELIEDFGIPPETLARAKETGDAPHVVFFSEAEYRDYIKHIDQKRYPIILQGQDMNAIRKIGVGRRVKDFNPRQGRIELPNGYATITDFKLKGAMNVTSYKVFDMLTEKIQRVAPMNISEEYLKANWAKYAIQTLTISEYIEKVGAKDRKEAHEQLKAAGDALFRVEIFLTQEIKRWGRKTTRSIKAHLVDVTRKKNKTSEEYEFKFSLDALYFLTGCKRMPRNANAYKINGKRNPNSYYFSNKLHEHWYMNNGKANQWIIGVPSLLDCTPELPTYEEVMSDNRHISKRIIKPFERDLEALKGYGILQSWEYLSPDGRPIDREQLDLSNYHTFTGLFIRFKLKEAPELERVNKGKLKS